MGFVNAVGQLHHDGDGKSDARIAAVVKVVPVVIIDVKIIGQEPVLCPVFWPGIQEHERRAAVREARIPHVDGRLNMHPKPVFTPEMETELGLRNVVTAITSTLRPGAMVAAPVLRTILLPCTMPLPGAALQPSPLLLPRDCLLPRTLRLLLLPGLLDLLLRLRLLVSLLDLLLPLRLLLMGLLDLLLRLWLLVGLLDLLLPLRLLLLGLLDLLLPLRLLVGLLDLLLRLRLLVGLLDLLLRLLSGLGVLLCLRPLLRLLCACLRLPLLCLRVLRLCALGRSLLLCRLALFFVLLVVLRVSRDNHPEKQKQGSSAGGSNESHRNHPPLRSLLVVHADHQSPLPVFQGLCCLRLGSGLVHRSIGVVGRRVERVEL